MSTLEQKSANQGCHLRVNIGGLELKNPIMPASGAFGESMEKVLDFNHLGAVLPKSITKYPRKGNDTPRVCEVPAGMINSIGIQSKGLQYYLKNIVPYYQQYDTPLIASISADSVEEFVEMADILGNNPGVDALELNISCPNLKGDGLAFGMDADVTYELTKKVRGITDVPLFNKLTPNVTRIQDIALASEEGGADALTVVNTFLAMSINVHTWKPELGNVMGGISGPGVKPIIVRMIYQVYQASKLPIIGCGGVMNGEDAIEMMLAGASAVQVGTASFIKPAAMLDVLEEIKSYMQQYGINDIYDIIGKVHFNQYEEG
ncbi:dihydroorotate dehydrogenase [Natribacillus halophilus]|uniref:Dihydroorotate dehydrogenase n=1 Tax=Natribacillus halophilus TaxID=549003 RepID=A0A1G8JXG5_9BACI|nr:dihydroorotate dehydrogenase [Natribacillus halophilus]SDI35848.1 dihydroorotate oxidase B, catalytic subunit [Natribacillus halophilus]